MERSLIVIMQDHEIFLRTNGHRGKKADLSGVDLHKANLFLVGDLSEADLRRAKLLMANLSGADLSNASCGLFNRIVIIAWDTIGRKTG